ncbi:MAG TPA: efflux RND transporter periplasmic adaptor subunit [Pyrinomonadaceae bacterium]|jgi:HlyD family secretion protein|nr:efflux RND transporter periplasmic adaptor subunit [Pyrinomonadaceae bacterium]
MSTQTIKQPLVGGISTVRHAGWLKQFWTRLLAGKMKLLIGGGFMAAVVLAGFYFWGDSSSTPQYLTARVERGNLRNTVSATGALQAVTTVQVGSQASGTISALYADFNSTVKKGQVVAQLDPAQMKAQVDQARANLDQARASLASARAAVTDAQAKNLAAKSTVQNNQAGVSGAEANLAVLKAQQDDALSLLKQQESLLKSGVIAQRDYDVSMTAYKTAEAKYNQAVAQLNQAKLTEQSSSSAGIAQSQATIEQSKAQVQQAAAQVQQAQAALNLAQVNLSHTTITSPIDGIVVSRDVNVGQTVAASLSAPTLFTIANDLTQMQVIANIDQADIGLVEQAKSVKFTVDAFPGKEYDGKIEQMRLNPVNVQNVVTYNVVIDVANPEQTLKPGMTANLTIMIDDRNNVLKVPNAALRFTPPRTDSSAGAGAQGQGQGRRRQQGGDNAAAGNNAGGNNDQNKFAPASAPVLPGQVRVVWVLGQDGKPQRRRITVGLSDGSATEVVDGDLKEGEMVITGQQVSSTSRTTNSSTPPGFGGAPRGAGGGGPRR